MSTKKKSMALRFLESLVDCELDLPELLRSIRELDAISQSSFAKMLNISKQTLCDIEKKDEQ